MRKPRWRKIIKVTKPHATSLMNTYFHHEHMQAVWYGGGLSEKKEIALLNTLEGYANSIERTSKIEPWLMREEWIVELMNFQG